MTESGEKHAYLCRETSGAHHFHTDKHQFYVGSSYLAVCCHCGRIQLIVWHGPLITPDLVSFGGTSCGYHYRR